MARRVLASILFFCFLPVAAGQQVVLSRTSIDGGGTMHSAGASFELSGTIGQPDAGVLTGGSLELAGGFWFELPPTDCNEDGSVNLIDYASLSECLGGPAAAAAGGCVCFDVNRSGAIDLRDFASSQIRFSTS